MVHLHVHAQETEGVPALLSAKSLSALGAVINFETGHAIFRNPEPETVVQLERSPTGHLGMDLFEKMPMVSDNPLSLPGELQSETKVGRMLQKSKAQVPIARTDSQCTFPSRPTHDTDTPDTTTTRRSRVQFGKSTPLKPQFDLKTSVTATCQDRRSDGTTGTVGMGTSCELGVHSFRKVGEKTTKSEMNDNSNVCAGLSQENKTELRDVCKTLSIPLSGHETKPQLTRKIKEVQTERKPLRQATPDFGRHGERRTNGCAPTTNSIASGRC